MQNYLLRRVPGEVNQCQRCQGGRLVGEELWSTNFCDESPGHDFRIYPVAWEGTRRGNKKNILIQDES